MTAVEQEGTMNQRIGHDIETYRITLAALMTNTSAEGVREFNRDMAGCGSRDRWYSAQDRYDALADEWRRVTERGRA